MDIAADLQLPSLPEVTLRALKACQAGGNYRDISRIVTTDTALVARILSLANSALYRSDPPIRSVEQALLRLGTHRFQTLLLTSALRQLLFDLGGDEWQQLRDFWRHSLTTALTARALATLTRYPDPDEAFLLGMVHNIGELMAIRTQKPEQKQALLNHQSDIAANLVSRWGLGVLAEDAMRYQQALPMQIRDASHLVKLISLATRLALSDVAGIAAAGTVFGLQEDLTRELNARIAEEVSGVAESFGIDLGDAYDGSAGSQALSEQVIRHAMAEQALAFGRATRSTDTAELAASSVHSLALLTGLPALCFLRRGEQLQLVSGTLNPLPDLRCSAAPGGSVVTEACHTGERVSLEGREVSVLDQQVLSLLKTRSMVAIPVPLSVNEPGHPQTSTASPAVWVLGADTESLAAADGLIGTFLAQLASRQATDDQPARDLDQAMAGAHLKRQLHEVSNPLTIIKQYIYQLRNRLKDADVDHELSVIQEELDRAGYLLLQISQSGASSNDEGRMQSELNAEIDSLARILHDSLFSAESRTLELNLCTQSTRINASNTAVRQVLINLIRNAVESFDGGPGKVALTTRAPVFQNQRPWVEMQITDNGPGIADAVKQRLFQPIESTKGVGHSGVGLSVTKQLLDDMEGIIACYTGKDGTTFRILFPAAGTDNQQRD
ncbi:MAG: HDOD domain-containing protein [Pseudomonadota bacterium]|nr:HDOD domain-containing protein [Pseudomonadota bacterium]